jgi:lysozyme
MTPSRPNTRPTRKPPYRRRPAYGHMSAGGVRLVASFEGFRSHPYRDAVGVWTIGYGHTDGVTEHTRPISRARALELLEAELNGPRYGGAVRALDLHLTAPQFDALVSFVYNLGAGAISPATGVGRELRRHRWRAAADHMLEWDHAGGRVLLGLLRRRQAERRLFLYGS